MVGVVYKDDELVQQLVAQVPCHEIDGIFQVSLDEEGKCNYFKQWRFTR